MSLRKRKEYPVIKKLSKLMDAITDRFNHIANSFVQADIARKLLYICCGIAIIIATGGAMYFILEHASELLTLALAIALLIWYKLPDPLDAPQPLTVNSDVNAIYQCIYEAICENAEMLGLESPTSVKSIQLPSRPSSDNVQRFFAKVRKKRSVQLDIPESEMRNVLSEEIQHYYNLNRHYFLSDITGLYLDCINDQTYYYELTVVPVTRLTASYITGREHQWQLLQTPESHRKQLWDDEF